MLLFREEDTKLEKGVLKIQWSTSRVRNIKFGIQNSWSNDKDWKNLTMKHKNTMMHTKQTDSKENVNLIETVLNSLNLWLASTSYVMTDAWWTAKRFVTKYKHQKEMTLIYPCNTHNAHQITQYMIYMHTKNEHDTHNPTLLQQR